MPMESTGLQHNQTILSWLRAMNKTARARAREVVVGRTRPYHLVLFSLYSPLYAAVTLIIESPEELWFSWTKPRYRAPNETRGACEQGQKHRDKNSYAESAAVHCLEKRSEMRGKVKQKGDESTGGWTKAVSTRALAEFMIKPRVSGRANG